MGLYDRAYYRDDENGQGFFSVGSSTGSRPFFVTLLIINVVVFFADTLFLNKQLSGDGHPRGMFAATSSDLFNPLLWWRFLTAGFSHDPNDIMHLVGNMIGLFIFGRAIEQTICNGLVPIKHPLTAGFGMEVRLPGRKRQGPILQSAIGMLDHSTEADLRRGLQRCSYACLERQASRCL